MLDLVLQWYYRCTVSTWPLVHLNLDTYTVFLVAGCGSWCATIRWYNLSLLIQQEEQSTKERLLTVSNVYISLTLKLINACWKTKDLTCTCIYTSSLCCVWQDLGLSMHWPQPLAGPIDLQEGKGAWFIPQFGLCFSLKVTVKLMELATML